MKRYKAIIEYCGSSYHGMQKQNGFKSVQETIESAISQFSTSNIQINYAGRTDAGVHAIGQVIQFDLEKEFPIRNIHQGINFYLQDEDVKILSIEEVDTNFDARFDAKERIYLYKIINRETALTFQKNYFTHVKQKLNIDKMIMASKCFHGRRNFNAFRSSECQAKNPIRTIDKINFDLKNNNEINIYFHAKSFLHNMVRIMTGTLINAGLEKITHKEIEEIILSGIRNSKCPTAKADGLYFFSVVY